MKVPKSSCASLVSVGLDQDPQMQEGETSLSRLALHSVGADDHHVDGWADRQTSREVDRWMGRWVLSTRGSLGLGTS